MSALEQLAAQMGVDIRNYEPSLDEMVELPPTRQIASELDYWRGVLDQRRQNGTQVDIAHSEARVRFWEGRMRVAGIRDERLAERRLQHALCFCLGRGGRNPVALTYRGADGDVLVATVDGRTCRAFEEYCRCPEGEAELARVNEIRAKMEAESRRRKHERVVGMAKIPPIYAGMTGDTWRAKMFERGATVEAVGAVLAPIARWLEANWRRTASPADAPSVLLLAGPYGTGKSSMAATLGQKWVDQDLSVIFRVSQDWFSELRASPWRHNEDDQPTEQELMAAAREADLFILDDWGGEAETDAGEARLKEQTSMLIDHRLSHGLPTILTTNMKRAQMKSRVGERILDRVTSDLISIRVNFNDLPNLRSNEW